MYEDRAHGDHSMYTGMQAIESLTKRTPSTHSKLIRVYTKTCKNSYLLYILMNLSEN